MVLCCHALAWHVLWYSLTSGSCWTSCLVKGLTKWHRLYITLADTFDYLDSSWHDESLGLICLASRVLVSVLCPSLLTLHLKVEDPDYSSPDTYTSSAISIYRTSPFEHFIMKNWNETEEHKHITVRIGRLRKIQSLPASEEKSHFFFQRHPKLSSFGLWGQEPSSSSMWHKLNLNAVGNRNNAFYL